MSILCFGATHADGYRRLTSDEVPQDCEATTGHVIALCFAAWDPREPAATLAEAAVTSRASGEILCANLRDKHFLRQRGADAYYGQPLPSLQCSNTD